jgi:hypothetical protein
VRWQELNHPEYPQCGATGFTRGLSALDLLFNCGPRARDLFWQSVAREREDERLAA